MIDDRTYKLAELLQWLDCVSIYKDGCLYQELLFIGLVNKTKGNLTVFLPKV